MNSLDALSAINPELTGERLDLVDGGLPILIVVAGGYAICYATAYIVSHM